MHIPAPPHAGDAGPWPPVRLARDVRRFQEEVRIPRRIRARGRHFVSESAPTGDEALALAVRASLRIVRLPKSVDSRVHDRELQPGRAVTRGHRLEGAHGTRCGGDSRRGGSPVHTTGALDGRCRGGHRDHRSRCWGTLAPLAAWGAGSSVTVGSEAVSGRDRLVAGPATEGRFPESAARPRGRLLARTDRAAVDRRAPELPGAMELPLAVAVRGDVAAFGHLWRSPKNRATRGRKGVARNRQSRHRQSFGWRRSRRRALFARSRSRAFAYS